MNFNGKQFSFADFLLAACCLLTRSFYLILCTCFIYEMQKLQLYAKDDVLVLYTVFPILLLVLFLRISIKYFYGFYPKMSLY